MSCTGWTFSAYFWDDLIVGPSGAGTMLHSDIPSAP